MSIKRNEDDIDGFYLRRFVAPIVPIGMAAVAATMIFGWVLSWRIGNPNLGRLALVQIGGALTLGLIARLCRLTSRDGRVAATCLVCIAYGATAASVVSFVSYNNKTGLLQSIPYCMILVVVGSFFATRFWQVIAGFVVGMTPPLILISNLDTKHLYQDRIVPQLFFVTLATSTAFYFFLKRFKRSYFTMLQESKEQSRRDPLTALYNRRSWYELGRVSRERSLTRSEPASLLFLDVDFFKQVNDRLGHEAGDRVLQRVAAVLQPSTGLDALVSRFGGEEFVILLSNCRIADAIEHSERIQSTLRTVTAESGPVTVSVGIAELGQTESLEDAVRRADAALLLAKSGGRDRLAIAKPAPSAPQSLHQIQDNSLHRTAEEPSPALFTILST